MSNATVQSPAVLRRLVALEVDSKADLLATQAKPGELVKYGASLYRVVDEAVNIDGALYQQLSSGYKIKRVATFQDSDPAAVYRVSKGKIILRPDGERFIVRGVTMFDYLFVSYEARANDFFREKGIDPSKNAGSGVSEPTYNARLSYIDEANVRAQIIKAKSYGINLIRVAVEPAIMYASVSYVDPTDAKTYPSDPDMLDTIVETARKLGVVVQLQNGNDSVATANNVTFLKWLTARYFLEPHVWINPCNEINGTTGDVNDPVVWEAEMQQYVAALREDIPGYAAGVKFEGPIVINPPGWGTRLDLVDAALTTNSVFSDDSNLIVSAHYYPASGETDWRTSQLATRQSQWVDFIGNHCLIVGEVGADNLAGRLDPDLDVGTPSVDEVEWAGVTAAVTDFLIWSEEQTLYGNQAGGGSLNGVIGHMWYAYIEGLGVHDDNSMHRQDGSITTWGGLFRAYFTAGKVSLLKARRALGADYATGQWSTGAYLDNSVNNNKLAVMADGTLKGRAAAAGSGTATDLTGAQAARVIGLALPTYADNAAATSGGLLLGDMYKTATGELRVRV